MRRLLIALALMLLALLGLAAPASFVAASALPTIATYGYDREHDIDGTDHTAPARGPLQHVPVDVSAGHRPGGDHGSHASVPRSGDAVNHARSAYGYDSPSASTTPAATPRAAMLVARPTAPTSAEVVRLASGCCLATKGGGALDRVAVRLADETGAIGRYGNLGKLADRADEPVADVIRSRGGGASQVNQLQTGYGQRTLGELSELAARGDREAVKAIKMAKQAGSQGKGGR